MTCLEPLLKEVSIDWYLHFCHTRPHLKISAQLALSWRMGHEHEPTPPTRPIALAISQQLIIGSSLDFELRLRGNKLNLRRFLKWRRPPLEDNLKILKVEYICNHWWDCPQILNLSLGDHNKIKKSWNEDGIVWKTTSKYLKLNISVTTDQIFLKF